MSKSKDKILSIITNVILIAALNAYHPPSS